MFPTLKTCCLLILLCINRSFSEYVNYKDVAIIESPQNKGIYFGYSLLLLQKSTEPIVVVGAPKQQNGSYTGGTAYKCDLNTNKCVILLQNKGGHYYSTIGNWLGSTIIEEINDLEETNIFTCSPRQITPEGIYYFLKGLCYKINDLDDQSIENITLSIKSIDSYRQYDNTHISFYKGGYSQTGFDLQYLQGEEDPLEYSLIFGAPGFEQWNGAVIIKDYNGDVQTVPERNNFINSSVQDYIGYSVRAGRFNKKDLWVITGAPRYRNLHGAIMIYKVTSAYSQLIRIINSGEKIGSYYGACLLVEDVTGDGYKDLFVGAPMASGRTWDEGNVHFYKYDVQRQDFGKKELVVGSSKTGARFGTAMCSLGDIDLDNFNDIAISAPYEDETGAVYLFKGSSKGPIFTEKILPEKLHLNIPVKGFGLGLSHGKDLDGNGHNDFVVGAYKTDQIFIIKTKSILTYRLMINIVSSPNLITNSFKIQSCIVMYWKNKQIRNMVEFTTRLDLDSRGHTSDKLQQIVQLIPGRTICNNISVNIDDLTDIYAPFYLKLTANISNKYNNIIAEGNDVVIKSVPFTDCGEDKICKPEFTLNAELLTPNITLGLTTEVNVDVNVINSGEYAYQCYLEIVIPKEIELRNTKNCEKQNNSYYSCLISHVLINKKQISLTFDIGEIKPEDSNLNIQFSVHSDGSYVPPLPYKIDIPILLKNDPYIIAQSLPQSIEYPSKTSQIRITHGFRVGNLGPSPMNMENLYIFMPQIENTQLISHIKASLTVKQEEESQCNLINASNFNIDVKNDKDIVKVDCSTFKCLQIVCNNNFFLPKSMEISYTIKFTLNVNDFVNLYQQKNKFKIEFATTATISNATSMITTHASTKFYVSNYKQQVPIWVYVLASILGLIILAIIVIVMYKMNFFARLYKEKMENEQAHLMKDDQMNNFD